MNEIRRYILVIFAFAIFFLCPDSFVFAYLKFFLFSAMLVFALYKRTCGVSESCKGVCPVAKNSCEDCTKKETLGDKQLILSTQQGVAYCMSLFRLRIAEILWSYDQIKMSVSEDDCWVLSLLKQSAQFDGPHWRCLNEEQEKKAEEEAILTYEKKFIHLFDYMVTPNDDAVIDMQAFLSVYSEACGGVLRRLRYFNEVGFLESKIDELIKNYSNILTGVNSVWPFSTFLSYHEKDEWNDARNEVRAAVQKLREVWQEVENFVISNLLVAVDAKIDVSACFHEIRIYRSLCSCFRSRLLSKNKIELEEHIGYRIEKETEKCFKEYFNRPSYSFIFE